MADDPEDMMADFAERFAWILADPSNWKLFEGTAGRELEAIFLPYADPDAVEELETELIELDATDEDRKVSGHATREMKIRTWLRTNEMCEKAGFPLLPYPFCNYKRDQYAKHEKYPFPGYVDILVAQGKLPATEYIKKKLSREDRKKLCNYRGPLNECRPGARKDDIRVYGWKHDPPRKFGYPVRKNK